MKDETGAEVNEIMEGPGVTDSKQKIAEYMANVVCPVCFEPITQGSVMVLPDRYGRKLRKYMGFCTKCNLGSSVIQFEQDRKWLIYQYQTYRYAVEGEQTNKWVTLTELPEPAPIVTGPGGDFDRQIVLTKNDVRMLTALRTMLETAATAIESFMQHFGLKE